MTCRIECSDAIAFMNSLPESSVDLVFGSPPYELCRDYLENGKNLKIARKTDEWVAWMVEVYAAAQRCCKGLVAFVVAGKTRNYRWSAGPALLAADLHRAGFNLRNPPIFHRVGIPGSGGPDWLRSDYEWIICTSRPGRLPWSDNTACGHPPKWATGGEMSHRLSDGSRVNEWGGSGKNTFRMKDGSLARQTGKASQPATKTKRRVTSGHKDGDTPNADTYEPPAIANPGNSIEETYTAEEVARLLKEHSDVRCGVVGGGLMGNDLASLNEAPFAEWLVEFFVLSFCPPGGTVVDCFSGSGTTACVSIRNNRNFVGCDLRQSQVDLAKRRLATETPLALFGD